MNHSYNTILAVHRGALGDFLNAWPGLLSLGMAFPDARRHFLGPRVHLPWAEGAGFGPPTPEHLRLLDGLFRDDPAPVPDDTLLVWFCLDKMPPIARGKNILVLPGLLPGIAQPPRESYRQGLGRAGVPWQDGFQAVWRTKFYAAGRASERALLFPGAGHEGKRWPLVKYFELAELLKKHGLNPVFVLGPAETERGVDAGDRPCLKPAGIEELQEAVSGARLVVGNDCGPMHLAGMAGVPGVVLFGPTPESIWTPLGLRPVSMPLPCRPCTRTTADLACPAPSCLLDLSVDKVWEAVAETLAGL